MRQPMAPAQRARDFADVTYSPTVQPDVPLISVMRSAVNKVNLAQPMTKHFRRRGCASRIVQ